MGEGALPCCVRIVLRSVNVVLTLSRHQCSRPVFLTRRISKKSRRGAKFSALGGSAAMRRTAADAAVKVMRLYWANWCEGAAVGEDWRLL